MRCGSRNGGASSSAKSRTNAAPSSGASSGSHSMRRSEASASALTAGAISLSASECRSTASRPLRSSSPWASMISARVTVAARAAASCRALSLADTLPVASRRHAALSTALSFHFAEPGYAAR